MKETQSQLCKRVLDVIVGDTEKSKFFLVPAISTLDDVSKEQYISIIPTEKHRDLTLIGNKLETGQYDTIISFKDDMELCFENCKKYCKEKYKGVYNAATALQKKFRTTYDKALQDMDKNNRNTPSPLTIKGNKVSKSKSSIPVAPTKRNILMPNFGPRCDAIIKTLSSLPSATFLLQPADTKVLVDYTARIPNPIDFGTIKQKLPKDGNRATNDTIEQYNDHNEFARDVRRVCANFLRYNCHGQAIKSRKDITKILQKFESLWLALSEEPGNKDIYFQPACSYYNEVIKAMEAVYKLPSASNFPNSQAVWGFIDPVEKYFIGNLDALQKYKQIVKVPTDMGTIMSKIIENVYNNIEEIIRDVKLISSNCEQYWATQTQDGVDSQIYIQDANKITTTFCQTLDAEIVLTKTSNAAAIANSSSSVGSGLVVSLGRTKSSTSISTNNTNINKNSKAPVAAVNNTSSKSTSGITDPKKCMLIMKDVYRFCLTEVKKHYIKPVNQSSSSLKILTAGPFLKSVDPIKYPDYTSIIVNPMNILKMEKNVEHNKYISVESIVDDFTLIRDNAHIYNSGDQGLEVRLMADALLNYFKYLLKCRIRAITSNDPDMMKWLSSLSPSSSSNIKKLLTEKDSDDVLTFLKEEQKVLDEERLKREQRNLNRVNSIKANEISPVEASFEPAYDDDFVDDNLYIEEEVEIPNRQLSGWEINADNILRVIAKHPYVNPNASASLVANFFVPVIVQTPLIKDEYLQKVTEPMDLTTLNNLLLKGSLSSFDEFFSKIKKIFQNCIDYNEDKVNTSDYLLNLVKSCKHLLIYAKWVTLENMPADTNTVTPENVEISIATRDSERAYREKVVSQTSLISTNLINDCRKLMKELEKCKNVNEKKELSYFSYPINEILLSDYNLYVRKAMDLSTIKLRLEGDAAKNSFAMRNVQEQGKPIPQKYVNYGEFLGDLRLVFSNAIKYNSAHKDTDNTGVSKIIYESALRYQKKLEGIIAMFSVDLTEKILRNRIQQELVEKENSIRRKQKEDEAAMLANYTKSLVDELKEEDEMFAKDFDVEQKKRETDLLLKARMIAQKRKFGDVHEQIDEEGDEVLGLAEAILAKEQGYDETKLKDLFGYGGSTNQPHLPVHLIRFIESKQNVLEEAWYRWTPFSSTSSINNRDDTTKMDMDIENNDNNVPSTNNDRPMFIEITTSADTNTSTNINKFQFNIKKLKEGKRKVLIIKSDYNGDDDNETNDMRC